MELCQIIGIEEIQICTDSNYTDPSSITTTMDITFQFSTVYYIRFTTKLASSHDNTFEIFGLHVL